MLVGVEPDADRLDPALGAERGEQGEVALGTVAEAEVLPHHHRAGVQRAEQDLDGEVLRGHLRQLGGERQHQHQPHAGRAQQLGPLGHRAEQRRDLGRPQHLERVAVEGDRRRLRVPDGGLGHHPAQQRLVAAVDAVEHADGGHGRAEAGRQLAEAVGDAHAHRRTLTPAPPWSGPGRRRPG